MSTAVDKFTVVWKEVFGFGYLHWLSGGIFLPNFIVGPKFSNPFVIFVLEWALVGKIFKLELTFFDLPC